MFGPISKPVVIGGDAHHDCLGDKITRAVRDGSHFVGTRPPMFRIVVQEFRRHYAHSPATPSLRTFYASAFGAFRASALRLSARDVLFSFLTPIETIGEAFSVGWQVTARSPLAGRPRSLFAAHDDRMVYRKGKLSQTMVDRDWPHQVFDHYYVRPAEAQRKRAALDAKLKAAGKPPSK